MNDWIDGAAAALGVEPLRPEEIGTILRLARDAAHRVERTAAPVAAYLAGLATTRSSADDDRRTLPRHTVDMLTTLMPERDHPGP